MFESVLIPTDGSEPTRRAMETGIELAAEHDATVHGLYVVEPTYVVETGQVTETFQQKGERIVSDVAEEAKAQGLSAVTEVWTGTAYEEILDYADENDIAVIVMGTHGRTGLGRYLLGSVTQKVVRLSAVPVLTVQADTAE
jgi:nucleotide-binding universal stress UspA family protein